jgi:hypothetical protein
MIYIKRTAEQCNEQARLGFFRPNAVQTGSARQKKGRWLFK